METEIRFYYSIDCKENVINYLSKYTELNFLGRFYECTNQYNHPMKKYDFYSKKIDGRFRVRKKKRKNISKCMITWKRRLKDNVKELINQGLNFIIPLRRNSGLIKYEGLSQSKDVSFTNSMYEISYSFSNISILLILLTPFMIFTNKIHFISKLK